MDLRQLRYFEAVVRHRHFTRAADELHVAQSAVSHQVQRLEQELGIELLRRTTRSVEPTEAGTLVAARARAVLAESEALLGEVEELRGLVRGRITVGALLFGGELDIPAILATFTSRFPHVEVGIREGTAQRMLEMLRDGSLDVSFALEAERPDDVERLELSSEEVIAAVSPRHPLAQERPLRVAELADHALIAFQPGSSTREVVDAAFARADIQPRIAVEVNDLALVRSLAARGLGVAMLPRSFAELPGPRVTVRSLQPALRMEVVLWWLRGRRLSPAARAFVDFTAERARRLRPARR
jgi:DNA-binding transcriptional LysR family regulator